MKSISMTVRSLSHPSETFRVLKYSCVRKKKQHMRDENRCIKYEITMKKTEGNLITH